MARSCLTIEDDDRKRLSKTWGVAVFAIAGPRRTTEVAAQAGAMPRTRWLRSLATLAVLVLGLLAWSEDSDARAEGGSSLAALGPLGFSRLAELDDPLPANATQPTYPGGSLGGLFNRPGLIGGFAAGFLGAGVVGLLFGHGMIGELTGFPAVVGLLFQLTLLGMLGRLIWSWWRLDSTASVPDLSPRQLADAYERSRNEALPDIDLDYEADPDRDAKKAIRR
jgi:hypothetical protein